MPPWRRSPTACSPPGRWCDIAQDYALTASTAASLIERLHEAALLRALSVSAAGTLLASEPETMRAFLGHVADRYGGFPHYLSRAGVSDSLIDRLVERLVSREVEIT